MTSSTWLSTSSRKHTDCIAADDFKNDANTQVCPANNIPDGWEGLDAGPASREAFKAAIVNAKTILWNGPAGVFEFDNFTGGSKAIAEAIAEATKNGAFSLIGGGDSVACINKFGMADQVSYISTGGGALLEAGCSCYPWRRIRITLFFNRNPKAYVYAYVFGFQRR